MKITLDSRIESLLTSEVGGIIHRVLMNGNSELMLSALYLHGKFHGKGVDYSRFFYKPIKEGKRYLDKQYRRFDNLFIDDRGFMSIRTAGWKYPLTITFRSGSPYLYFNNELLEEEKVVGLSQQSFRELQCILENQHPLVNEENL